MNDSSLNQHIVKLLIQSKSVLFFAINSQMILEKYSEKFKTEFQLDHSDPISLSNIIAFNKFNPSFTTAIHSYFTKDHKTHKPVSILTENSIYELEIQFIHSEDGTIASLLCLGKEEQTLRGNPSETAKLNSDFSHLLESAGDGMLMGDERGHIINLNKKIIEFTGYSREEVLGKHISYLFYQGNLDAEPLQFEALDSGQEILKERIIQHKDGSKVPIEMLSKRVLKGYITIMRDISERIETQLSLKEITNRLLFVTKMERIGIIDFDLINRNIKFNKEMISIFGNYKVENLDDWYGHIHPDDVDRVKEGLQFTLTSVNIFEFVYRLKVDKSSFKTIKASANIFQNNKHERNLIISNVDITDSSITKAQLREHEQIFNALTTSATAAIFIYREKFLYVNQSFQRITGYSIKEAKQLDFWNITHPDYTEILKQRGKDRFAGKIVKDRYEFKIITKDGEEKWIDFAAAKINYLGQTAAIGTAFDITERKELEIQLKANILKLENEKTKTLASENRFKDYMYQNSAVMIALDPVSKNIIFANQAAEKLYGYTNEEFLQKKAYDLNPLDPEKLDKIFERAVKTESQEHLTLHKTKDGSIINVQINSSPVLSNNETKMVLIIHDKTSETLSESMLKESHNTYRNIINSISEMIYILDSDNRFLFVNNAAIEKYGHKLEDFIGNTPAFLSAPGKNDMDEVLINLQKAYHGEQNTIEFWGLRKNKEIFPKEVVLSPGYYFGKKAIIVVSRDVSESKRITNELITAKNKAEESDQLKSAFLANMSHEIRTPMNAILGFTDLIRDPEMDNEERYRFLNIIHRSSNHLLNLINDLIDISKIYSNQMSVTKTSFELNALLFEIFEFFEVELVSQNKEKDIEFQISFGLPYGEDMIITDETRLRQILNNIVGNAIKFTRKGMITIDYKRVDGHLIFTVQDTGIGISDPQKAYIFDRFSQADSTISREFGGTGLGLAISKACTELLGGSIWMKSMIGKGTEMNFSIKYEPGK